MIRALWLGVALGCVVVPVSEIMFWPVHVGHVPGLVLYYGAAALLAACLLERSGLHAWLAVVLAACVLGWLVEGVIVSQTYEAVPFSLIWTALAWHGLLSVGLGLVALRAALRAQGPGPAMLVLCGIGMLAGLWNAYGWERLAPDVVGGAPDQGFALQVVGAATLLALGHALLDHLPGGVVPGWLFAGLSVVAAGSWAAAWALPLFPASLVLPALLGITAVLLWRVRMGPAGLTFGRVRPARYAFFALIPTVAIPVQRVARDWPLVVEMNVWVAVPASLIAACLWLWAVGRVGLRRV